MTTTSLTPRQAAKQYMFRMMGAAGGYIGAVFGAAMVLDNGDPLTLVTFLVAAAPVPFIWYMLNAFRRYLREMDEVARHDHTQAILSALFVILAIGGGWGLIEMFNDAVPRISIFWVFPGFFLIYGLVACLRYGRTTC